MLKVCDQSWSTTYYWAAAYSARASAVRSSRECWLRQIFHLSIKGGFPEHVSYTSWYRSISRMLTEVNFPCKGFELCALCSPSSVEHLAYSEVRDSDLTMIMLTNDHGKFVFRLWLQSVDCRWVWTWSLGVASLSMSCSLELNLVSGVAAQLSLSLSFSWHQQLWSWDGALLSIFEQRELFWLSSQMVRPGREMMWITGLRCPAQRCSGE